MRATVGHDDDDEQNGTATYAKSGMNSLGMRVAGLGIVLAMAVIVGGAVARNAQEDCDEQAGAGPAAAPSLLEAAPVDMTASALSSWCDAHLMLASRQIDTLLADTKTHTQTKAHILNTFNLFDVHAYNAGGLAGLLQSVHPDAETRAAAEQCSLAVSQLSTATYLNHDLYELVNGVSE